MNRNFEKLLWNNKLNLLLLLEKSELSFCYVPGLFVFLVLIMFQMNGYEYDLL